MRNFTLNRGGCTLHVTTDTSVKAVPGRAAAILGVLIRESGIRGALCLTMTRSDPTPKQDERVKVNLIPGNDAITIEIVSGDTQYMKSAGRLTLTQDQRPYEVFRLLVPVVERHNLIGWKKTRSGKVREHVTDPTATPPGGLDVRMKYAPGGAKNIPGKVDQPELSKYYKWACALWDIRGKLLANRQEFVMMPFQGSHLIIARIDEAIRDIDRQINELSTTRLSRAELIEFLKLK